METGPTWTQPDKNPTHPEAAVSGPGMFVASSSGRKRLHLPVRTES